MELLQLDKNMFSLFLASRHCFFDIEHPLDTSICRNEYVLTAELFSRNRVESFVNVFLEFFSAFVNRRIGIAKK